jgi:hypothetical protein
MAQEKKGERTEKALKRIEERKNTSDSTIAKANEGAQIQEEDSEESLFAPAELTRASYPVPSPTVSTNSIPNILGYAITPTTSYPRYRHLHDLQLCLCPKYQYPILYSRTSTPMVTSSPRLTLWMSISCVSR